MKRASLTTLAALLLGAAGAAAATSTGPLPGSGRSLVAAGPETGLVVAGRAGPMRPAAPSNRAERPSRATPPADPPATGRRDWSGRPSSDGDQAPAKPSRPR